MRNRRKVKWLQAALAVGSAIGLFFAMATPAHADLFFDSDFDAAINAGFIRIGDNPDTQRFQLGGEPNAVCNPGELGSSITGTLGPLVNDQATITNVVTAFAPAPALDLEDGVNAVCAQIRIVDEGDGVVNVDTEGRATASFDPISSIVAIWGAGPTFEPIFGPIDPVTGETDCTIGVDGGTAIDVNGLGGRVFTPGPPNDALFSAEDFLVPAALGSATGDPDCQQSAADLINGQLGLPAGDVAGETSLVLGLLVAPVAE